MKLPLHVDKRNFRLVDADNEPVADRCFGDQGKFIATCVNSHDALVNALRGIAAIYDDPGRGVPAFLSADLEEIADIAKQALKAARETT